MPTLRTTIHRNDSTASDEELVARLTPRTDVLVAEVEVAPGRFHARSGPFSTWTRTVTHDDHLITEEVSYRVSAPFWGPLVDLVLRRAARRGLPPGANPWWAPAHRLEAADAHVLGVCASLSLVTGFLGALIGRTMTFVAGDLGKDVTAQSVALAVIALGAVLTLVAMALADRVGRRPLLRWVLLTASAAALLTAASPNLAAVSGSQLISRGMVDAAAILIPVVCAEELPAHSRGYAVAIVALAGGLGAAVVLWFLPLADLAPWAWRPIYLLALPAAVVTLLATRRLPETRRFLHDDHLTGEREHQRIVPRRFALLAATMFLIAIFAAPTQQLQNEYLRTERGFSAMDLTVFLLFTNLWGGLGLVMGGRLSDRRSRRLTLALGIAGLAVGNGLMFAAGGPTMWVASSVGSLVGAAVIPSLGALLPELFPTLRRSTASGLLNAVGVVGSITGLIVVGRLVPHHGYGPTILTLAIAPLVVAVLALLLPESAGRELEELNPDEVDT